MAKLSKEKIHRLDLDVLIEPKKADRIEINADEVAELAGSISEIGQLQPIIVRPSDDKYEIVAGQRRYLACKLLDAGTVEGVIREMTDEGIALAFEAGDLKRGGPAQPIMECSTAAKNDTALLDRIAGLEAQIEALTKGKK